MKREEILNILNKPDKSGNTIIIDVPDYVNYISDWKELIIPGGHIIIDKTICGCGFTEFFLRNTKPTILCAPRKLLLEEKSESHNTELDPSTRRILWPVYYFKNDIEETINYDIDIDDKERLKPKKKTKKAIVLTEEEKLQRILDLKNSLIEYLQLYCDGYGLAQGTYPPKILVTYDSLKYVVDALGPERLKKYQIVIDEFQAIFSDSSFKSEIEMEFLTVVQQHCKDVVYLSATPMLSKYIEKISYFNNLPFYKLNWGPSRSEEIIYQTKFTRSLVGSCTEIIKRYKDGFVPQKRLLSGEIIKSTEMVFFFNSVKSICEIIKSQGLTSEECNIICSSSNKSKIEALGPGFTIGRMPLKKEVKFNKPFTFCTRTAYLGADFYSTCARTYIFSNINIRTLAIDISLDLQQIVGRQRLDCNPWKNEVIHFKAATHKKDTDISLDEFLKAMEERNQYTIDVLRGYSQQDFAAQRRNADVLKSAIKVDNYTKYFIGFKKVNGVDEPVRNDLIEIAQIRGYEITQPSHIEHLVIRKESHIYGGINLIESHDNFSDLKNKIYQSNDFATRAKLICDYIKMFPESLNDERFILMIPNDIYEYIRQFGVKTVVNCSYKEANLKKLIQNNENSVNITNIVQRAFQVGQKYLGSDIKKTLQQIYSDNGINLTAKAVDLDKWFNLKNIKISVNGKQQIGYKIINIK